jgi:hypothetical protein
MSDIVNINKLQQEYLESKQFSTAQQELIDKLLEENAILKQKLSSLEHVALSTIGSSPEEIVCLEQIARLKERSHTRELSLDEVKRLDLLIKNLRLIKEQSTENVATAVYRDVGDAELVAIATKT